MSRKKIVIMTVGLGGGHKAMARNLVHVLGRVDDDLDVKVIDVIADGWPSFNTATTKAYAGSTTSATSWLFRLYYVLSDRFPRPIQWFANLAFARYARRKYAEERPDMIIATFPFLAEVAARARDYHHGKTPIILTITDAGRVQGIWLSKVADMTLTATEDTVPYLIERGLDPSKVRYIGFPAADVFYESINQKQVRRSLGLRPDLMTILLTAGGAGLNPQKVLAVAQSISTLRVPYQLILNAGSNDDLKAGFEAMTFPYAEHVIIEGFTDKMPDYMRASDIICSKSGWLTINEALVMQRMLVLYDAVPGHEEQNVEYVVGNHFGIFEPVPHKIAGHIREFMQSPELFQQYAERMRAARTNQNPYDELAALFHSYLLK